MSSLCRACVELRNFNADRRTPNVERSSRVSGVRDYSMLSESIERLAVLEHSRSIVMDSRSAFSVQCSSVLLQLRCHHCPLRRPNARRENSHEFFRFPMRHPPSKLASPRVDSLRQSHPPSGFTKFLVADLELVNEIGPRLRSLRFTMVPVWRTSRPQQLIRDIGPSARSFHRLLLHG